MKTFLLVPVDQPSDSSSIAGCKRALGVGLQRAQHLARRHRDRESRRGSQSLSRHRNGPRPDRKQSWFVLK